MIHAVFMHVVGPDAARFVQEKIQHQWSSYYLYDLDTLNHQIENEWIPFWKLHKVTEVEMTKLLGHNIPRILKHELNSCGTRKVIMVNQCRHYDLSKILWFKNRCLVPGSLISNISDKWRRGEFAGLSQALSSWWRYQAVYRQLSKTGYSRVSSNDLEALFDKHKHFVPGELGYGQTR
jgi:hypothetical protein